MTRFVSLTTFAQHVGKCKRTIKNWVRERRINKMPIFRENERSKWLIDLEEGLRWYRRQMCEIDNSRVAARR